MSHTVQPPQSDYSISGQVLDESNIPLAGAIVRVKASKRFAETDRDGNFSLTGLEPGTTVTLTAWAEGYYIGGGEEEISIGTTEVKLILKKHHEEDHAGYQWLSAYASQGKDGNCENCHFSPDNPNLPFTEWTQDAHALATQNPRFLAMYLGQDIHGNQSPSREYAFNRDYGQVPLFPDLSLPYFGPGYKLDFPETAGNCAACHTPAAAIDAAYETDPTRVSGVGAEGVACDLCHKVWDVHLDPASGLPRPNMPGVLSFEFRRPPEGHQFFAGPLDDVAPGEDTFTPIQTQSQFCAPCHFGSFWDVQIYDSFGEWLESPYSSTETGQTCQDCHMPPAQNDHFALPEKGGVIRDPETIFSHRMPGAADIELLQNAVTMTASARMEKGVLTVDVSIMNDRTGHHVPTDSPLRQLILLVTAMDISEQPLPFLEGETVPAWGGTGDPALGYYAGLPGKGFAKILRELWTDMEPAASYWNPTRIVSDNRIAAFGTDTSTYQFSLPTDGGVEINIRLLFRRAFRELMDQKDWEIPDILMEEETIRLVVE